MTAFHDDWHKDYLPMIPTLFYIENSEGCVIRLQTDASR